MPQAVTTVWRTELGTTLLIGFDGTTVQSAYFRYLCSPQFATNRQLTPSSSPAWPRLTGHIATKELGKGTGLGLSTVYGIIQQNHGTIHVTSSPGRGTTFEILLPVTSEGGADKPAAAPSEGLGGSETILVAEDETGVRKLVCETLEQLGYTVLQASDGREALLILEQHGSVPILLTDVMMPVMGGPELAKRAKSLMPGIKVVYMSGYTDDTILHHGGLEPGSVLMEKPFSGEFLLRSLRQALDT